MTKPARDPSLLVLGDVVVIVWNDASTYRDTDVWFTPDSPGSPGTRNITVGIVVNNINHYVRLAQDLAYFKPDDKEPRFLTNNTYIELPHSWIDTACVFGNDLALLEDIWKNAREAGSLKEDDAD